MLLSRLPRTMRPKRLRSSIVNTVLIPYYHAKFVDQPDEVLAELMELPWLEVTEARKEYFMSDAPRFYTYGKPPNDRTYQSADYSLAVRRIQMALNLSRVTGMLGIAGFNICFLNRYDTQKHQLGWHADDSPTMDHDHPIAVVSFGAEREIWWKHKDAKGEVPDSQRLKLEHGSLFIMPPGFQRHYFHRIPKADRPVGVRVSLTFRRYLPEPLEQPK